MMQLLFLNDADKRPSGRMVGMPVGIGDSRTSHGRRKSDALLFDRDREITGLGAWRILLHSILSHAGRALAAAAQPSIEAADNPVGSRPVMRRRFRVGRDPDRTGRRQKTAVQPERLRRNAVPVPLTRIIFESQPFEIRVPTRYEVTSATPMPVIFTPSVTKSLTLGKRGRHPLPEAFLGS